MYQDTTSDPIPDKNAPWFVKIGWSYRHIKDISLSVAHLETRETDDNTVLIVSVSVAVVLIFLAIVVVIVVVLVYLKGDEKPAEEPVVDPNMYYGNPGEDYPETTFMDNND